MYTERSFLVFFFMFRDVSLKMHLENFAASTSGLRFMFLNPIFMNLRILLFDGSLGFVNLVKR